MRWLTDFIFRVRALLGGRSFERDLESEFAFHLEMETQKLMEQGMPHERARQEARRRFGSDVRERERAREAWGLGWIRDLQADTRQALRQFRKHPGFAFISVLTLALGIGATVALFSVVQGIMLRPLPFPDEDRVVVFWSQFDWRGVEFDFAKERVNAYQDLAAYTDLTAPLRTESGSILLINAGASAELFDVLSVPPLLGRTFAPGEDRPGAEPVIVLSHGLWQQEFGGDLGVLGQRVVMDGVSTTVIGVMPPGFFFPTPEYRAWRPLMLDPATQDYRGNGYLALVGRVRPAVTTGALEADVQSLATALGERFTYPEAWDKSQGAHVISIREYLLGDVRPAIFLLLGAVTLLLLMSCANAAALTLARTTDRTGEMSVRVALGAGRGRIARQVLTESLVLAIVAAVVGAVLAVVLFDLLVASLPLEGGYAAVLSLSWTVFAAAFGLALVVGIAVAAVPVRELLRGKLENVKSERSETGLARGTGRAHATLVAAEVLLAVLLVAGAALLIRSVANLRALELGLEPEGVVAITLFAAEEEMSEVERESFFWEVAQRASQLPGVRAAGTINRLPIRDGGWQGSVGIESRPDLAFPQAPNSYYRMIAPGYFQAMGIELRMGRVFDERDREGALPVAIVSESFARRMWPGQDPIGQRINGAFDDDDGWRTVVGVVEETRLVSMTGENPLVMYVPQGQAPFPGVSQVLVLEGDANPTSLVPTARRLVRELNERAVVAQVQTMDEVVTTAMAEPLRLRFFLMLFAGLGLVLGTVGVYGVVSYAVTRRQAEYGIRMALGATAGHVLREVVRRGMVPVTMGVTGGVVITVILSRAVGGFLYEVAPTDPVSLGLAAVVLLLSGVVAAVLPAWRAGRVSPVDVLRSE